MSENTPARHLLKLLADLIELREGGNPLSLDARFTVASVPCTSAMVSGEAIAKAVTNTLQFKGNFSMRRTDWGYVVDTPVGNVEGLNLNLFSREPFIEEGLGTHMGWQYRERDPNPDHINDGAHLLLPVHNFGEYGQARIYLRGS